MTTNRYISFRAVTPDGETLDSTVVTAWTPEGQLVFQETFDLGEPGATPSWVVVPSGEYRFAVRADGYTASAFLFRYTIPEIGPGSSPNDLHEILVPVVSTKKPGTTLPCRVYGHIRLPSANNAPGGKMGAVGTTYDDGPTTHGQTVRHLVWFEELSTKDGEVPSLQRKSRTRVAFDREGYFEAYLLPETHYNVILPDTTGYRRILTPGSGQSAELETLIQATTSLSLSELQ